MNGNFEHDKGAYPYTATRIGDNHFVVFTPTQENALDLSVPRAVGERIAMHLNIQYYGDRVRTAFDLTLPDDRKTVKALALLALTDEFALGDSGLTGQQYQQLKDLLK